MTAVAITGVFALAVALRTVAQRLGGSKAVDQWYWKLYVETARNSRRFPPDIPEYALDERQWYPPVFPLLLCKLPDSIVEAGAWLSIVLDLARLGLLLVTVSVVTGGGLTALVVAGCVYATMPILVSYNTQLNPRGLGALLLDSIGVIWLAGGVNGSHSMLVATAVVFASLILLTHKMTSQLMIALWLALAIVSRSALVWSLFPLAIVAAWVISGGFYANVLRAHWDIVTFWNRNWRWLQADAVRESPLYGDAGYRTPTRFYGAGWRGVVRHLRYLVGFAPWAWLLPFALVSGPMGRAATTWALAVLVFAIATVAVRPLRCLGSGYYYLYNAAFPVALAWSCNPPRATAGTLAFVGAAALSAASLAAFYRQLGRRRAGGIDTSLAEVVEHLRRSPRGTVWCLPLQPSDQIAYQTRQRVLYGGHGYGFRRLEPVFPRITTSASAICRQHDVRYVLTLDGYLPPALTAELSVRDTAAFGRYRLLALAPAAETSTSDHGRRVAVAAAR